MRSLRPWLLVGLLALAASVTSLRNGFVYDDVPVVQEDERIRDPGLHLFAVSYWGAQTRDRLYRPLATASFAADWAAGGGSPFGFHLTNVALNLVVVLLVYALARRVLGAGPAAFVAAAWFALHPVHVEVVANVVGRSELLAAAGYLTAVLAYLAEAGEARVAPGSRRRAAMALLTLAGAALAFGGKEHALTLPAALLLGDAWRARAAGQRVRDAFRCHLATWLGVVALGLGYLALRAAVIGTTVGGGTVGAGLEDLGLAGRAMVMMPAVLVWARLLLLPLSLSADYSPNHYIPELALTLRHVAALLLIAGTGFLAWAMRRRTPAFAFGLAWFVVTASVAANVLVPTGIMLAERTLYLPSAGVAIAAGALWNLLPRRRPVWPVTAALVALLGARTIARVPAWRDGERFYQALLNDAPASYRTFWAIGARAFEEGRVAEGERAYLRAIQAYPGDGAVMQELGERYASAGAWAPAERWLSLAWRVDSLRYDAGVQAVLVRIRLGQVDSAVALGVAVIRRFPDAPTILVATSDALFTKGQPLRALSLRRRAVFAAPAVWQLQHVAAEGAMRAGRCEEARWRVARAAALAPGETAPRELKTRLESATTCPPA